ncbi:hypothetical protein TNCV_223711 [Trichonephila clavipes]|nr:hypothetical protein TNCV_223711 [Trichonephila clavipes]
MINCSDIGEQVTAFWLSRIYSLHVKVRQKYIGDSQKPVTCPPRNRPLRYRSLKSPSEMLEMLKKAFGNDSSTLGVLPVLMTENETEGHYRGFR